MMERLEQKSTNIHKLILEHAQWFPNLYEDDREGSRARWRYRHVLFLTAEFEHNPDGKSSVITTAKQR